jgi:Protein of unknown function (DUF3309)
VLSIVAVFGCPGAAERHRNQCRRARHTVEKKFGISWRTYSRRPQPAKADHGLRSLSYQEAQSGPRKGDKAMSIGTILVILLIIFLLGGFSGRFGGYGYGFGHGGVGIIGLILIVVVVLMLLGRL